MGRSDKLAALGRTIAALGDEAVEARARPPVEKRLSALRAERDRRSTARGQESLRRPIAIGLALGSIAAVAILWPAAEPLTFAVGEPTLAGASGSWIVAPDAQALPIGFSDGTRVRLEGGARVRVIDVTAHGARVAIERGTVRADVVPRAGNDWSVVGGPFEIHVTGTSFDAGWDPEAEVLRVVMHEGRVIVRGACLDHDRALAAGESATLSCASSKQARASGNGPAISADVPRLAVPSARGPSVPSVTAPPATTLHPQDEPATSAAAPPASWRELARRSDYKGALAAAEIEGFGALCESLSAAELLELGTTARLAARSAQAMEAYGAVRRRFGGSDAAANAAFHLGQLAFDGAHAFADAHRWFSTYLAERPGGPLAAEALGRKMEAEQRLGSLDAARETARTYLARYPGGAHAELAKSLMAP
ncbi:hypothetical protein A7982_13106 [Minicystis rosea]|nr:hypothetical protein A7982_13106 [Minicystis rosea]